MEKEKKVKIFVIVMLSIIIFAGVCLTAYSIFSIVMGAVNNVTNKFVFGIVLAPISIILWSIFICILTLYCRFSKGKR